MDEKGYTRTFAAIQASKIDHVPARAKARDRARWAHELSSNHPARNLSRPCRAARRCPFRREDVDSGLEAPWVQELSPSSADKESR